MQKPDRKGGLGGEFEMPPSLTVRLLLRKVL